MKPVILILCLLGAAYANPILHKMAMEMIQHASNSSESSSISESSDQSNTSEPSEESKETVSDSNSSESTESESNEPLSSESHSVERLTGQSETALISDNTHSSKENVRRGWIYTLKWVNKNNNNAQVQATSQPEENDIKSTSDASKKSESSESSESQETAVLNTKVENNGGDTSESTENSYIVDGTEYSNSNSSSSSSSSESSESKNSEVDSESRSTECQPGADSQDCDSEEDFPQDIGDDGATDPFNGILMPDVTEP
ncbi:secretory calcium-binding phosphoprotein 1 [Garra rufa]|uniref:secretory calcium-binding phosphoprotein 1 n=1 Tax=Garra rufa TaxID=137080 RepID=UPI003CCED898